MFGVYAVAVRVNLVNNVTSGLMGMSRQFARVHGDAVALQKQLDRIKLTALAGTGLALVGGMGLHALTPALDKAKEFQTEAAKFELFGLGSAANNEAMRFAKTMNVVGVSYIDNMRLMTEAQGVFRESGKLTMQQQLEGAKLAAPVLAKIQFATEGLDDTSKARMRGSAMDMLRFVEMRGGLQSPQRFNSLADAGWKAIRSSGGNIDWTQMRQFMATGGVAAQSLSDTALFGKLEPIIGEMKGNRAGTALMTSFNRLNGNVRLPNQVVGELMRYGIWDRSKVTLNSMGGVKSTRGNPLVDAALFGADPTEYYRQKILPMYSRMGLDGEKGRNERNRLNTQIFGRTGGAFFSLYDRQQHISDLSVDAQRKALGINASANVAGRTLAGQEVALRAKMNDLLVLAGQAILPLVVSGLETLIPLLQQFSTWALNHPKTMRVLVVGFAALSAAMAFGGTVLLLAAAFSGLRLMMAFTGLTDLLAGSMGALGLSAGPAAAGVGGLEVAVAGLGALPFLAIAAGIAAVGAAMYFGSKAKLEAPPDALPLPKSGADAGSKLAWAQSRQKRLEAQARQGNIAAQGELRTLMTQMPDYERAAGMGPRRGVSPAVPQGQPKAGGKAVADVHLDGKKVGKVVWRHQNDALDRAPNQSSSGFDPVATLAPVGMGYQRT